MGDNRSLDCGAVRGRRYWRPLYCGVGKHLVRGTRQAFLDAAELALWASVDAALCAHGRGGSSRVAQGEGRATVFIDRVLAAPGGECTVVDRLLWPPGARVGACGNRSAMGNDCVADRTFRFTIKNGRVAFDAVFALGNLRGDSERGNCASRGVRWLGKTVLVGSQ